MKKIVLLLLICLFSPFILAQKYKDIHTLQVGDWLLVEHTEYYPYSAPGIKEETPWRAENIRRVVMKATVTNKSTTTVSFDFSVTSVYDCRNQPDENLLLYYDSRYKNDFPFYSWHPVPSDSLMVKATYDIASGHIKTYEQNSEEPYLTYSRLAFSIGLINTHRAKRYNSTQGIADASRIPQMAMPQLINNWNGGKAITASVRQEATFETQKPLYSAVIGLLPEDVTHNLYPSETRVIDASFLLPPNVVLAYTESGDSSVTERIIRRLFIPHPMEYYVENDRLHYSAFPWLISPGDSIVRVKNTDGGFNFTGKGSAQNRLYHSCSKADEVLVHQLDVYWKHSFELRDLYNKANRYLLSGVHGNTINANNDSLIHLLPLVDGFYNPSSFKPFLNEYMEYKQAESLSESLSTSYYFYGMEYRQRYYNNKHFLFGYPRYLMNADNLLDMMRMEMFADNMVEYNDFINHCPDINLTNKLKHQYNVLQELERGKNIKNTDIEFIKKKLPLMADKQKYIVATLFYGDGYTRSSAQYLQKKITNAGLNNHISSCFFYPGTPTLYYTGDDKTYMDSLYTFVGAQEGKKVLNRYGYGSNDLTILMREDGTILYRSFGGKSWLSGTEEDEMLQIVKADMNRSESDFHKGFKKGLFVTLAVVLLLLIIIKIRYDSKRRKEQTERHITELELKTIRSQMNPHFIFNALSSIQNLIGKNANDEANQYLIHFARLLRNVLSNSEKKLIPLSEELEQISLYLKLEQLRIPFNYQIEVDPEVSADIIEIPGMLIQPFVENAVKHAIAPQGGGEIILHVKQEHDTLRVEIVDDGPGIQKESTDGFGIKAITEELKLLSVLNGKEIKLEIENRQDKEDKTGCRIILQIPVS
ncbi:sensor histidine kinase [Bacteroides sp. 519]|uniref:sensor histidine kinase n=1 Tax=Bacteroides sp. 519 TaxID=2302937 RepID=UPI0013D01229|nr:histidine kinase [Bacteroides sp. 519]NDV59381.1 hypothetical protein [Bacteroides sp. 519]